MVKIEPGKYYWCRMRGWADWSFAVATKLPTDSRRNAFETKTGTFDADQAGSFEWVEIPTPEKLTKMKTALEKALEELEYIDTHCGVKNEHGDWIGVDPKAISSVREAVAPVAREALE